MATSTTTPPSAALTNITLAPRRSVNKNKIPILKKENLHNLLNKMSTDFITNSLYIDSNKRTVVLPEVVKFFLRDFGDGTTVVMLKLILRFLDRQEWEALSWLLQAGEEKGGNGVTVKYRPAGNSFHPWLVGEGGEGGDVEEKEEVV